MAEDWGQYAPGMGNELMMMIIAMMMIMPSFFDFSWCSRATAPFMEADVVGDDGAIYDRLGKSFRTSPNAIHVCTLLSFFGIYRLLSGLHCMLPATTVVMLEPNFGFFSYDTKK